MLFLDGSRKRLALVWLAQCEVTVSMYHTEALSDCESMAVVFAGR